MAAVAATIVGCASTSSARQEPTPRQDFLEYRSLVVSGLKQVDSTLRALDRMEVQADQDPRSTYRAFAQAVQELEVGSIRVRARAAAIRARGEAYFQDWDRLLGAVNREDVRRLAQEHRAELKQSFQEIRAASQQARENFRLFLSDLQKLRAVLEGNPTLAGIDSQKALFLAAQDKGSQVQLALSRILAEMNTITATLTPPLAVPRR